MSFDRSQLIMAWFAGLFAIIAIVLMSSCIVDVHESDNRKDETKYEQCGEIKNETARTFCVTEA